MSFSAVCFAILTELSTDMSTYAWEHGWLDEPPQRRDRGFVWGMRVGENPEDTNTEIVEIGIRMFPNFQQQRGHPRVSTVFEDAAESLQSALKDKQTIIPQNAGYWFMRVTEIVIDQELQRVDATVLMWGDNTFAQQ